MQRPRRWRRIVLALLVVPAALIGLLPAQPSAVADEPCAKTDVVLGVQAANGWLVELDVCVSEPAFGASRIVDYRDWRGYVGMAAARDGSFTLVYTTTPQGTMQAHRQTAPGGWLSTLYGVGYSVDWATAGSRLIVTQHGQLAAHTPGGNVVRIFNHEQWDGYGYGMQEENAQYPMYLCGPAAMVLSIQWGRHIELLDEYGNYIVRGWDCGDVYGNLPVDPSIVGSMPAMYRIGPGGTAQLLGRPDPQTPFGAVATSSTGGLLRLVAPVDRQPTNSRSFPTIPSCPKHQCPNPWDWV
jgi:hypothetical protein